MLKVKLIEHTPNPEKLVAVAAKMCYSSHSVDETAGSVTDEKARSFVAMLADMGHQSPLEHISFTFAIEGVSRAFLAQITRHRIASYSVRSQRYVNEGSFGYVIPPEIEKNEKAKSIFLNAMNQINSYYNDLVNLLKQDHTKQLILQGKDEKSAEKAAQKSAMEDARFVLPNACETKLICTFNARSLINFFELRCCNRAQWEIREVATKMLELVSKVAPNVFLKAGPACIKGKCPEGKMSCGQTVKVREYFGKIKGIEE